MADDHTPIILCPLVVEQQALLRAQFAEFCNIQCCGPGAMQIGRWFAKADVRSRPIVLAGLAGGVAPSMKRGEAYVVSRVLGFDGREWEPNWPADGVNRCATATVVSSQAAIVTPHDKRLLAHRTGAHLVDLESAAFAEAATLADNQWTIVRGVSDDAATSLPIGIDQWVDGAGRTRLSRVLLATARRPWLINDLFRLQGATRAALTAVAAVLGAILEERAKSEMASN